MLNVIPGKFGKVAATLLFSMVCVAFIHTKSAISSEQSIVEGAKKEKILVLYTHNNIQNATLLLQQFKKKYPFISYQLYRTKSEEIENKVEQETRAKRYIADVVNANHIVWNNLIKKKLVMKYKSPETATYPKHMRDSEDYWSILYLQIHVMAYNSKLVSPKEAPKNYEDLLDPKWKGKKIGLDSADPVFFAVLQGMMGTEKCVEFMKRLSAQDLYFRNNKNLLTNLLAAGEYSILANTYLDTPLELMNVGAPIGFHPGSNPIPSGSSLIGISAYAPHPNAAKLYIDFVLSQEGQKIIASPPIMKTPSRPGVESELNEKTRGYELHPADPPTVEGLSTISKQFREIFFAKR